MANKSNAQRLRELMAEYDIGRPTVAEIITNGGLPTAKITVDSWLARKESKLHRNGPSNDKLGLVTAWCKKHGKRKG